MYKISHLLQNYSSKEARQGIRNCVSTLTLIDHASCEQTWLVHEICSWSHCHGKWTSCGRLQSHPPIQVPLVLVPDQPLALELGVDRKVVVGFRTRLWKSSSLWSKFLCHRLRLAVLLTRLVEASLRETSSNQTSPGISHSCRHSTSCLVHLLAGHIAP